MVGPVWTFFFGDPLPATPTPFEFSLRSYLTYTNYPVYQQIVPQSTGLAKRLPAFVIKLVSEDREQALRGSLGLVKAEYRLDALSQDGDEVIVMSALLRRALANFKGKLGDCFVQSAVLVDRSGEVDEPIDASDNWTYVRSNLFRFVYRETSPFG